MEKETKRYLKNMGKAVAIPLAVAGFIAGANWLLQRDSARTQRNNVSQLQKDLREAVKQEYWGNLPYAYSLATKTDERARELIRAASNQRPDTYDFSAPVPVQDLRRIAAAGSNIAYRIANAPLSN